MPAIAVVNKIDRLADKTRLLPYLASVAEAHEFLNYMMTPEVIARAYKLTPTELRVLLAIVDVGGVPEVALVLGVAESTVKTHLGHLFEKTGVAVLFSLSKSFDISE